MASASRVEVAVATSKCGESAALKDIQQRLLVVDEQDGVLGRIRQTCLLGIGHTHA